MTRRSDTFDESRLGRWLEKAVKGLPFATAERIRGEISSHFEDVFTESLNEGMSVCDAEGGALKSLGSARAAGRGFRRTCLTQRDEDKIWSFRKQEMVDTLSSHHFLPAGMLFFCHLYLSDWMFDGFYLLLFLNIVILSRRGILFHAKLYKLAIAQTVYSYALLLYFPLHVHNLENISLMNLLLYAVWFLVLSWAALQDTAFWRKLDRGVKNDALDQ